MERVLGDVLLPTSILDFKPKLENRCKLFQVYALQRALILDFKPRLENRCKDFPIYGLLRALILNLRGVNLGITAGKPSRMALAMQ